MGGEFSYDLFTLRLLWKGKIKKNLLNGFSQKKNYS